MSAAVALAQFQMIAPSKLEESELNPRKEFDEKKLGELIDSVKAKGMLEPLLVRPVGKGFEVVAGARRYRAAKAAGLAEVPCLVREMTDAEALEVAILENVCREDISAMDEGDAYRALVKLGHSVESLVEKTGRSRTVVFARMKLAELQGDARKLVLSGEWSASIGELIARLPTERSQAQAMKRLQDKARYKVDGIGGFRFREAKEILEDEFVLQLKDATFDVKDVELIPGAGACGACPNRTGAPDNKEAFRDVKSDTCLDEQCWNKKKSASFRLLQAELAADGKKLVKEPKLTQSQYGQAPTFTAAAKEKYSKPGEEVLGEKTWKDLLGDEVPKVVVLDGNQKTHNLVDRKAALKLLEEKDPKAAEKLAKADTEPKKDDWQVKQAEQQKKRNAEMAAQRVVCVKAMATVTKLETAIELVITSLAANEWKWKNNLRLAGLPEKTKADGLKPAQKVRLLLAVAFDRTEDNVIALAAKLTKLDVKALTKKALAAEPGTCFACGCTQEKQCRAKQSDGVYCVDGWVKQPKATLCVACGGEEED